MDWAKVADLILAIGLPAAEHIITNWENKADVTVAEIQSVRAKADQHAKDRMAAMLATAGIDLNDPKAVAMLALTGAGNPAPIVLKPA